MYILNLQPALYDQFFGEARLSEDVEVKVYKTFPRFLKGLQSVKDGSSPNLLLFLPSGKLDPAKTRQLRLTMIDSLLYIVTGECDERAYLTYISMGVDGIISPPFNRSDLQGVLRSSADRGIPFPRNNELIKEGQVRLDFLVPSKLSRILGVNRLISFLSAEFGFPPEESRVNLPMVVDEALSNAIVHGNRSSEDLKVHVRIYISSSRIRIQIEDQGEGFIPEEVSDPTEQENIYKGSGRGIFMLKELMDSVEFKKGGRLIELEKLND
ncbi:MAG: ATP-binding protein [Candidatus Krumholzibacteria bacterium]|nr:ATP-binding protein [Candidatus Krumholzibacteria bacterium]